MAANEGNHAGLRQGIYGCGCHVGSRLGVGDDRFELALARGKKVHDKRDTIKERDWKREQQRLLKNHG